MVQTHIQIWQHRPSGERFVIEVDYSGTVIGAAGPLHHAEIAACRAGDFTSDAELAAQIDDEQEHYAVVEPTRDA